MPIADIRTFNPDEIRLSYDEFDDLRLTLSDGGEYAKIDVIRSFPLTSPQRFIMLVDRDGEEIGIIDNLAELDKESIRVVKAELAKSYFVPEILRINSLDEDYGVPRWDVETDRGPRRFQLRSRRDSRLLEAGRVLIQDIDGNRYAVPDYRMLDARSQALIEEEV
jgi:hypothetical protein